MNGKFIVLSLYMKTLFLIIIQFSFLFNYAQFQSTEKLISKLNNTQFIIEHNHKAEFRISGKEANKLIQKGKAASDKLIKALENPDKTIMAHLVLCHIYYKKVSFAGPKVTVGDTQDIYKYYLGKENGEGLIISEVKENGKYKIFVEPKDMEQILNYWKNKEAKTK